MEPKEQNNSKTNGDELTVRLDFGGTEREFNLEEMEELAKKAYTYELIIEDWNKVKAMAQTEDKSVSEYLDALRAGRIDKRRSELLEKGADEQLADYILSLENTNDLKSNGFFDEVVEYFPKIKDISELPECVVEAAKLKGSRLLDEWLRYRHKKQMELSAFKDYEKSVANSSIGSQKEHITADFDPAKLQFIKGVWGK